MREVKYDTRQGPVVHMIYEPEEADRLGIEYFTRSSFSLIRQGDWILTDDGYVVQVVRLGAGRNGQRWLRTCTGTFPLDERKAKIDTEPRESRYSFSGKIRKQSHQRFNDQMLHFAKLVARGMDIATAYKTVYPDTNSDRYAKEKGIQLLGKQEVQKALDKELGDILKALGIDREYVLSGYKELAEDADNDSVRLSSLNSLAKIIGLIDQKRSENNVNVFQGFDRAQLESISDSTYMAIPERSGASELIEEAAEDE